MLLIRIFSGRRLLRNVETAVGREIPEGVQNIQTFEPVPALELKYNANILVFQSTAQTDKKYLQIIDFLTLK
jgi:hypothetical protein